MDGANASSSNFGMSWFDWERGKSKGRFDLDLLVVSYMGIGCVRVGI